MDCYNMGEVRSSQQVIDTAGNKKIKKIFVKRSPVTKLLTGTMSAFSFGKFGKRMYKNFDECCCISGATVSTIYSTGGNSMRKGHMHRYEWSRDNDSGTAATRKSPW